MKSLRSALPNIKIICDTDSVWSKFLLRELPFIHDDNRKKEIEQKGKSKEKEESEWVNFADITTAVSEIDAEYYRSLALNTNKIKIFANVIDLDDYNFVPNQPDKHTRPAIFMGGTFWKDSPMEKAARWFISDIYSKLSNGIHGLKLYIVGKNSDKILSDIHHKDIIITGEVESVLPYLCYSDLAVVPLFFESGTRFKILEAGACRIPVVSTTLGAEGIDIIDGKNILIADTAEDFIESVTKLINHRPLAFEMSERLNMLVKSNYSINTLERQALEIIKYLTEN
jgi:glycosyltransferase involved in cell wall biosynthesis